MIKYDRNEKVKNTLWNQESHRKTKTFPFRSDAASIVALAGENEAARTSVMKLRQLLS